MRLLISTAFVLLFSSSMLFAQDIDLPKATEFGGKPVFEAIKLRHSNRDILDAPLDRQTLSDLLWVAYGFNRENMRTIPTALNKQELAVYVFLKEGVYLFDAANHRLKQIVQGDHRSAAGRQDYVAVAPVNLVYVADRSKETGTGAYISCGCAVENVYLACVSKGIACRVRTSLDKEQLHELMKLRADQEVLAGQTIAKPKADQRPVLTVNTANATNKSLPRASIDGRFPNENLERFLNAVKENKMDLHSIMIVKDGKVICEDWFGDNAPNKNHVLWSVSKTFTSMGVGFAVAEKRFSVEDKVVSFFPEDLPEEIPANLAELRIKDLLTMSVGHDKDPTGSLVRQNQDEEGRTWEKRFLSFPIPNKPGTKFVYNSLATYMLSSIIQKTTGETLVDYLRPRLFEPLGIENPVWDSNPYGVNCGGWGLHLRTEDMAKLGLLLLQKGKWGDKQILPESWIEEATTAKILQNPAVMPENSESDWQQGYAYQIWRCRHGAFRADGKDGQFIVVLPDKKTVVVLTANIGSMQKELNLVWEHLLPAL